MLGRINALSPTDFENLTYDSVRAAGLKNLVWRTPGADGGRDIEGLAYSTDVSGHELIQKWYVECKHYSSSIDWPTIYKKIAHADVHNADVLLLVTNNNPSPACETEIATWNGDRRRRPSIRVWRGYDLKRVLTGFPHVASSYGLIDNIDGLRASVLPLSLIISSVSQAAYVRDEFEQDVRAELELGSGLAELLSSVLARLEEHRRLVASAVLEAPPAYDWLDWTGPYTAWEEVGIRALLPLIRFVLQGETAQFTSIGSEGTLTVEQGTLPYVGRAVEQVEITAQWSRIEISAITANSFHLRSR